MVTATAMTRRQDLARMAKRLAAATVAGVAMGALVGGVGGRVAMLILRLTSNPSLHGLETDDGFIIGIVSTSTLFLVMLTAALGALGGLAYLVVRSWLPSRTRAVAFGALTGLVGGSLVIRPGGLDFARLDPLPLAIVMFVVLPAAYGVGVAKLTERWSADGSSFVRSRVSLAGLALLLPPLALGGPRGLLVAVVLLGAFVAARWVPAFEGLAGSAPVVWAGRAALLAIGIAASAGLLNDVTEIL